MKEQTAIYSAKVIEQTAAGAGASLGFYALLAQHKDLIIALCAMGSFGIALLGWITSTALTIHYKNKKMKYLRRNRIN